MTRHVAAQLAAWVEAGAGTPGVEIWDDRFFEYVGYEGNSTKCYADVMFLALIGKGGIETARFLWEEWKARGSGDFEPLWVVVGKVLTITPKEAKTLSALDGGDPRFGYQALSVSEVVSGLRDGSLLDRF